jgi:hypothetical protein
MAIRVNEVRRNERTGRVERTGRYERPAYVSRGSSGGYSVESVSADEPLPSGSYSADRTLSSAQQAASQPQTNAQYEGLTYVPNAGGQPYYVRNTDTFSSRGQQTFIGVAQNTDGSTSFVSRPASASQTGRDNVASYYDARRREGGAYVQDYTTGRLRAQPSFSAQNPQETRIQQELTRSTRTDRILGAAAFRGEVQRASGRQAQRIEALQPQTSFGKWTQQAGSGYFRAREQLPELYAIDAGAAFLGYGAGRAAGAGVNLGVRALSRAAPAASLGIVRGATYAGATTLTTLGAYSAVKAVKEPREFGATGATSLLFFGGAGYGFSQVAGVQPIRTTLGRPRAEIRVGEYGANTISLTSSRTINQRVNVFGTPLTNKGVTGVSGLLRYTERGGVTGELTSTTALGGRITQTPYFVAQRGSLLAAYRPSDNAVFALPISSQRRIPAASAAYLDTVRTQTGRLALINQRTGRVERSQPFKLLSSEFSYRGSPRFAQKTITLGRADTIELQGFSLSRFTIPKGERLYGEGVTLRAFRSRPTRNYGQEALNSLRQQGIIPEAKPTRAPILQDRRGNILERTFPEPVSRGRGSTRSPRVEPLSLLPPAINTAISPRITIPQSLITNIRAPSFARTPSRAATNQPQLFTPTIEFFPAQDTSTGTLLQPRQSITSASQLRTPQTPFSTSQLPPTNILSPPIRTPPAFPPLLPPILPIGAEAGSTSRRSRGATRSFRYAPSLNALLGGATTTKEPNTPLFGFETRPVVRRTRPKRKK